MKSAFAPNTLETALLYNDVAKKKPMTASPEAAEHARADLGRLAGAGRLQAKRHPDQMAAIIVTVILMVWSITLNAPLEEPANPDARP